MHVDYFSTNGEHVGLLSCYVSCELNAHVKPCANVILSAAARRVIFFGSGVNKMSAVAAAIGGVVV